MLLINKLAGPTSHDIVNMVRKRTGEKRVGHTGTLDPFAEGLLIVLVGREETKLQKTFLQMDKKYLATLVLGEERDTGDLTGKVVAIPTAKITKPVTLKKIKEVANDFTGEIIQVPPQYSAIKVGGKKAYEYARQGEYKELAPRKVTVRSIKIIAYKWPRLEVEAEVSSGTYIRALARDIGRKLGTYAYLEQLTRTAIGPYKLEDAIDVAKLDVSA